MNFPLVLDIALGLIFIYFILSLLASEIQEIIGTLLQWRAEHLKQSIEGLLAGQDAASAEAARDLSDRLYDSPLIRSLNQEARGGRSRRIRCLMHGLGQGYRWITRTRNTFGGATSGPSYIPAEAFANSLLESLQLEPLQQLLASGRLKQLVEERLLLPINHVLNDLKASMANETLLDPERRQLEQSIQQILVDFQERRVTLADTLERLLAQVDEFMVMAEEVLPADHHLSQTFLRRVSFLKRQLATNSQEKTALLNQLWPSLKEVLTVFEQDSPLRRQLLSLERGADPRVKALVQHLKTQVLPDSLKASLMVLAEKGQKKAAQMEDEINQMETAVATWFNRGMDRASGVYKRNAKAVALILGVAIAITVNADSLHIATRLAADPTVRLALTQAAEQYAPEASSGNLQQDLSQMQDAVHRSLDELPFPLGHSEAVVRQQQLAEADWQLPVPRRLLGWLISGIAIAMGANFWFDLLKKVIGVRSSGKAES